MPESSPSRRKYVGSSPWLWMCCGLFGCLLAIGWGKTAGAALETPRLALVWLSLLCAGIGVALRFQRETPSRLANAPRLMLLPAFVFALFAIAATVVLVASWFGEYLIGFRPGLALFVWLFTAPVGAVAALRCFRRTGSPWPLDRLEEACLSLLMAALTTLLAVYACTNPDRESTFNLFTIQRFFFIAAWVMITGAALTAADNVTRRVVVSGLVLFHFGGILTATLGHPPSPWLTEQIWVRIYRPYLQFMYLNNAYHFYSPEPGPANYLWFRLNFVDATGKANGEWLKIPQLDDKGRHGHKTTLEYFRLLAVTDNVMHSEGYAGESDIFQSILEKRLACTPEGAKKAAVIGQPETKPPLLVPMHPGVFRSQQYHRPRHDVKHVLASYARHVVGKQQQKFPERTYTTVKIYRVVHVIPSTNLYWNGFPPTDPRFYNPIYLGEYDPGGKLLDKDDPLLYWHIPILRDPDRFNDIFAPVYDWARRHAGDRFWRRIPVQGGYFVWVDDDNQQE